jgi:glycosyltransferase involved in cell wall biosynthesis
MKVLMFGWEFPPHISGGLGTACFGLTKGLAKHQVEILFVVPKAHGDEDQGSVKIINASDVEIDLRNQLYNEYFKRITYLEVGAFLVPYMSPQEYHRLNDYSEHDYTDLQDSVYRQKFEFSGKYGKDLLQEVSRYAVVATRLAREQHFDVIHAHDWMAYPAGIAAKEVSGKPFVAHIHATEFDRTGGYVNQTIYDIERKGMEYADRVIAVSHLTRNTCISKYNIDPDKVSVVHNGVIPREEADVTYNKHLPEKIVTFLGRITFQKGPEYFVEAAAKVLKRDPNVRFVMAGSGDMLNRMIKRVAQLRISSNFNFTGFLQGTDVDKMFGLSDVYVMPSVSEPFGISPLEAMRSNVPVIISKQSGVAEVLNHAVKVDFWDIDAMANAIYSLLHYNGLSGMFAKHGKEEVENLKWENAAAKVKDVYSQVLLW